MIKRKQWFSYCFIVIFFSVLITFIQKLITKRLIFCCSWRKLRRICQNNKNSLPLIIFYRNHYKFFKIIIISHNLLLTFEYICNIFYTFKNWILYFHSSETHLLIKWNTKSQEILYVKYAPILKIRYNHVHNHFNNKFISLFDLKYLLSRKVNHTISLFEI